MMSAAEFLLLCKNAGLTADEINEWNIGTIIDFINVKNSSAKNKDSAYNDEERYMALKKIEPTVEKRYSEGLISEEKYQRYKYLLSLWEDE